MENQKYLAVDEVMMGSEAEKIGLKKGDLIVDYDGVEIKGDLSYFLSLISKTEGKDKVILNVLRDSKPTAFTVKGGKLGITLDAPKDKATVLQQQKNMGIVLTVLGGAVGIWVFTRFTSVMGQMHSWSPPFSEYENVTLLSAGAAIVLIILGLINLTKK